MILRAFEGEGQFELRDDLAKPLLVLARQFGWRPEPTAMPVYRPDPADPSKTVMVCWDHNWRGDHLPPQRQVMTRQDTLNLIHGLTMAMRDIEQFLAIHAAAGTEARSELRQDDLRRHFADDRGVDLIRSFIAFCRDCPQGIQMTARRTAT